MRRQYEICDWCGKGLSSDWPKETTGITFGYGYSLKGWGRRRDIHNFSGEVCNECYEYLTQAHSDFWRYLWKTHKDNKEKTRTWWENIILRVYLWWLEEKKEVNRIGKRV